MTRRNDREREKTSRETLGKFFYDLAKANFTTFVAGSILTMAAKDDFLDVTTWCLLAFGVLSTVWLAIIGYKILKYRTI